MKIGVFKRPVFVY